MLPATSATVLVSYESFRDATELGNYISCLDPVYRVKKTLHSKFVLGGVCHP